MARVCQEWFPKGTYRGQKDDGFYMDDLLKAQLDILLKNIKNDWDFTLIITGGGEVRVGKSLIASQIGCYWSYQLWKLHGIDVPWSVKDNFVFRGKELIERGNHLGVNHKYSVLDFDEAGGDLQAKKIMSGTTQDVLDYFRECGQYNLLNLLVMPDFFELPASIAITRSIALIDVYYNSNEEGIFERGFFNFYSRHNKKMLYLYGKKERNYKAWRYDFHGRFYVPYAIEDEEEYRKAKLDALKKREPKKKQIHLEQRNKLIKWVIDKFNAGRAEVGEVIGLTESGIKTALHES